MPAFATFTDLDLVRPIWSSFPVSRLSKTVGVTIVEPGFTSHSIQHLALTPQEPAVISEEAPKTLLGEEEMVASVEDPDFGLEDENDDEGIVASLQSSAELGARPIFSIRLYAELIFDPSARSQSGPPSP